jgi:hypothetical protein
MSTPLRIVIPDSGSLEEILSFNDGGGANEEISDEGGGDHEAAAEQVRSEKKPDSQGSGVPIAHKRRITTAPDASSSYKTNQFQQALLDTLSESDIDTLARVSYAFWAWERLYAADRSSSLSSSADDVIFQKRRSRSARREIRRFCVAERHDDDKSLHRIRAAIKWRQVQRQIVLRD